MSEYTPENIARLMSRRELGLPLKESGSAVRKSRNNHYCDYEFLKSLLCDHQVYLEVIACRKVARASVPSYCHNRLFTNNYHSWFNLCTSPTSGPQLMNTNVFSGGENTNNHRRVVSDGIKIMDGATLYPPNGCMPKANSQHEPCILLLAKTGWLYQFSLEDAKLLSKIFIPTDSFADEFVSSDGVSFTQQAVKSDSATHRRLIADIVFNYRYVSTVGEEGKVRVFSSAAKRDGFVFVAHAVFKLFPLRFDCHFITVTTKQNSKMEMWDDIFSLLSPLQGSSVALYSFKDIQKLHCIESSHVTLYATLLRKDLLGKMSAATVGSSTVGCPYTMLPVNLDRWECWAHLQLFETKAQRHIFHVGGVPYHYAVPVDKLCTTWSLRSLSDGEELSRFHVEEKWDSSHIWGFEFHNDDSGRILLVNKGTITMLAIGQEKCGVRKMKSCSEIGAEDQRKSKPNKSSPSSQKKIPTSPCTEKHELLTNSYNLRVVGSIHSKMPISNGIKCHVEKCFEIDVSKSFPREASVKNNADCWTKDGGDLNWVYPQSASRLQSSSGRLLREPHRFGMNTLETRPSSVIFVGFESEMGIIAVLHFKYGVVPHLRRRSVESFADLVLSLYDNLTGERMNCVVVEQDLSPSDEVEMSVILDEDTVLYMKSDASSVVNYKIMRFCRKP